MVRSKRLLLLLVTACVAGLAFAPTAPAKALKAPKWLKGPYHRYTAELKATNAVQASETDNGQSYDSDPCNAIVTTEQASSSAQVQLDYDFLFGRSFNKLTRKYQLGFVWKRSSLTGTEQGGVTDTQGEPSGCPPAPGDHTVTCSLNSGFSPPDLNIIGPQKKHGSELFGIDLKSPLPAGQESCNGDFEGDTFDDQDGEDGIFAPPSGAYLIFTDKGVKAGHRYTVPVGQQASHVGDTHPDDSGGTVTWSYSEQPQGTLTFAPAK